MKKRNGEYITGYVPQFDDIWKVEVGNAKKFLSLPARYVFQAENIVSAQREEWTSS